MTKKEKILQLYMQGYTSSSEISELSSIPGRTVRRYLKEIKEEQCHIHDTTGPLLNISIMNGMIFIGSDPHVIPNREMSVAAKAFISLKKKYNPLYTVINGDLFDFSSISKHDKLGIGEEFTVQQEIACGVNLLNKILNASNSECIMLQGNHDARFNKILANHLPQFKGVKGFDITDHIPKGWLYSLSIKINTDTMILHSHHGGVHAAYNNALKGGINVITGHTHILEAKPITDYRGTRFGVQTGTLSTIKNNPLFGYTMGTPLNWQAGFVVLTFKDGRLQYPEICWVNDNNEAIFRGEIV